VGYTGGSTKSPSYYNLADHTESIQIDFDPTITSYSDLLQLFWNSHSTALPFINKQYMSAIFYSNEQQEKEALSSKKGQEKYKFCFTKILPLESWTNAENYHQKYYLRNEEEILNILNFETEVNVRESHIACRLNGYVAGKGEFQDFERELKEWNLSEEVKTKLHTLLKSSSSSQNCLLF